MGNMNSSSAATDSTDHAALIDALIAEHQVVIFSKTWCGYCGQTKRLFKQLQVGNEASDVWIIELDSRPDGNEIQQALAVKTGQRTVPNVFVGQSHVGGNDDVQAAYRSGKLSKMLQ